jgi:Ser/Thr protein kinase RdoA (MazF antagonist)
MREPDFYSIIRRFRIDGNVKNAYPYGSGHINDSYKVLTNDKNFLLQRINHEVFKDVRGLTSNISKVNDHLSEKITGKGSLMQTLTAIRTLNGEFIYKDDDENYWRVFDFIENSKSYNRVENPELAYEGGKAYGWFIQMLNDFPVNMLVDTIPRFHDINFRLDNFLKAVQSNPKGRAREVEKEIEFVNQRADEMKRVLTLGSEGKIPVRVTHNDTKINNVLFDHEGKGICVIDLDTVMPGYVHYDFGDAIRTFTNTADEDEKDLAKVSMNLALYEGFAKGFLSETKSILHPSEIETLAFSAKIMTFIIGLRFLTDYLAGDIYYKTHYPVHNLTRAKVQFKLIESMEAQMNLMEEIIRKH